MTENTHHLIYTSTNGIYQAQRKLVKSQITNKEIKKPRYVEKKHRPKNKGLQEDLIELVLRDS